MKSNIIMLLPISSIHGSLPTATSVGETDRQTADCDYTIPDFALLSACADFDNAELRSREIYNSSLSDSAAEALAKPVCEERDDALDRMCAAHATTVEGLRARATSIDGYDHEMLDKHQLQVPGEMVAALLRDLVEIAT